MKNKIYYANKLADEYGIILENSNAKPVSILGGYIQKLENAFACKSNLIKFKMEENNMLSSNLIPGIKYKRGSSNTYHYIQSALWMFGIIENRKYSEEKMFLEGWTLKGVASHENFESYLMENGDISHLKSGLVDKIIYTSIIHFLMDEETKSEIIENSKSKISHQIISRYSSMFDYIYMLTFKDKTPFHKQKLIHFVQNKKQIIKTRKQIKTPNEIKRVISKHQKEHNEALSVEWSKEKQGEAHKKINENKLIIKLRDIHREDIKNELNTYKKAINVIDKYVSTFNIQKQVGPVQEAAHIMPVYKLVEKDRLGDIANHHNGLLLDPTTHRMFDKNLLIFSEDNSKLISNKEKIDFDYVFEIPKKLLTKERIDFIEEWKILN